MIQAAIPFPDLHPVLFQIGPFALRWYALAYIAGLLLGWWYVLRLARRDDLWPGGAAPFTRAHVDDFLLWAALGIILGGRLGYVLFYHPAYYWQNPLEALALWHGGMSFHGGLAGIAVAVLLFGRARGLNFLSLGDAVAAAGTIGLFFGRLANFINAELYGRVTTMPWGVVFPGAGPEPRHPSQLYEAALEGLLLFALLSWLIFRHRALRRPGLVAGLFFTGYGLARIFVEFFRLPDAHIGYLWGPVTMGMLLSVPMIALGLGLIAYAVGRGGADRADRPA